MPHTSRFLRLFPPPHFVQMPAAGIDISDRSVHIAELVRHDGYFSLGRYGNEPVPEGYIVDGVVKNPEGVRSVLRGIARAYNLSFVRASLPEEKGYLVQMEMPRVSTAEIRESIHLQLEGYVPLDPATAIFDYEIPPCTPPEDVLRVNVSVMPRDTVVSYREIFRDTGLMPLSFELEAQALARSVMQEGSCETTMIVDIGASRTGFSIVRDGSVRFTSTANVGGDLLTDAIAKNFKLSTKDARDKKEHEGLLIREGDRSMYMALAPIVSVLSDEINRRILYWNTTKSARTGTTRPVESVMVCGGEANVPGLREYVSFNINVPVHLANPWVNVCSFDDYVPKIPRNHALRYATALGLALRRE